MSVPSLSPECSSAYAPCLWVAECQQRDSLIRPRALFHDHSLGAQQARLSEISSDAILELAHDVPAGTRLAPILGSHYRPPAPVAFL